MKIIGVTGGIASGKSLISFYLTQLHYPIFDADAFVHYLYQHDREVIDQLSQIFPRSLYDNMIDRRKLSDYLIEDQSNWQCLENIIHPLVVKQLSIFIKQHRRWNYQAVVINIPLLFEIKADRLCDRIIIVTSDSKVRAQRLAHRKNHNPGLIKAILKKQNDKIRRKKCIYIKTGLAKIQVRSRLYQAICKCT